MKVKKSILAMILVLSISVCLMAGCMPNSSKNLIETETKATEEYEPKLFEDYSKQINTIEGVYKVRQDISKKFSKAITDSGLTVANSFSDGSFVVSIGGFENPPTKSIQSLNYSMSEDYKKGKATLYILCAKEYPENMELFENDKYVKAIYNIFKSLTNTKLTETEFFDVVKKTFNKKDGIVELPYKNYIPIKVVQVNKSGKYIKTLQLSCNYDFDIPKS
ncbi:hypothetical protein IR152_06060 [Clostridioides sp. ES-S-0108-01]|uniref:hypothetical protein n=1 Tax=unclassified Clostridioides TaxID=2635829 RepID=UPI001D0C60C1|nr:hypothetical protein [Clostridioides sp. ES-S-0171-01]MCC0688204.1 hypothetical protein [Clostridioides sp. ES-S-0056-01]MCC0715886.1 hypothetical protein [Clostridioides sp. ES-S-0077-01]MCC0782663.1 hypothetical protein [Clostridioides sp. ES-S-0108-01]UDN50783.1 hypothetical protein JJC16_15795 [Clostridioides sp. ES-S-0107-01]UDN54282.1 hypothetical protein JJC02_15600 [Clostridioides sp. ES-S-0054-01]